MMHFRFSTTTRQWALAGLMVWVLFGCSRCRRGDESISGLDTNPEPAVTTPGTDTELTQRPPSMDTVIAENMEIVYFDYDSDALDADDRAALERDAEWLRENPDVDILIEGHCDERGTDEYNYNLGERRANSVLSYLQSLNVPNSLYTRSYGETRPAREGHDESAWRWNRRVQFSMYAE